APEGRPSLDLGGSDQVRGLDHPGPRPLEPRVLLELGAGHGRADAPAAFFLSDRAGLRDLLDIDDEVWIDDVGPHLNEQVGAPGEHARLAGRRRQQGHGSFNRVWCLVTHGFWSRLSWCSVNAR